MISEDYLKFDLCSDYRTLGFGKVRDGDFITRFYPMSSKVSSCLRDLASIGFLYNFIVESKFQLRSRVRAFKGPFKNRNIKLEEDYKDNEVLFSEKLSAYVGVRKLRSSYFEEAKQYHYDFSRSFLLCSEEPISDLLEVSSDFLNMKRTGIRIEYEKLLPFLGKSTLIKYWGFKNDQFGYIVVAKDHIGCEKN